MAELSEHAKYELAEIFAAIMEYVHDEEMGHRIIRHLVIHHDKDAQEIKTA